MTKPWIGTKASDDMAARQEGTINAILTGEQKEFWGDEILALEDDSEARYQLSLNYLPLPGAFFQAARAMRDVVKAKRKLKESYKDELTKIYWLAVISSYGLPRSKRADTVGFNIFEITPAESLFSLDLSYKKFGYEKLTLLTATDKKWIIEAWGDNKRHSTLNSSAKALWREAENRYIKAQKDRWDDIFKPENYSK